MDNHECRSELRRPSGEMEGAGPRRQPPGAISGISRGSGPGRKLKKRSTPRERGFTLVELLVVFAILSILAGILLPTLARGKAAALSAQCVNNQKQIGVAMSSYVAANSAYPWWPVEAGKLGNLTNYFRNLFPYTGCATTNALYHCPTYRALFNMDCESTNWNGSGLCPGPERAVFSSEAESVLGSYAWNYAGVGANAGVGLGVAAKTISQVKNPSNLIALADAYNVTTTMHVYYGVSEIGINTAPIGEDPYRCEAETATVSTRHGGDLNVLFADGHVESIGWRKLLLDRSDDALRKWNYDNQPHREMLR